MLAENTISYEQAEMFQVEWEERGGWKHPGMLQKEGSKWFGCILQLNFTLSKSLKEYRMQTEAVLCESFMSTNVLSGQKGPTWLVAITALWIIQSLKGHCLFLRCFDKKKSNRHVSHL